MSYYTNQQPGHLCGASLNDCYSRKQYQPCGKPAVVAVTLYGSALSGREKSTAMCQECYERTVAHFGEDAIKKV